VIVSIARGVYVVINFPSLCKVTVWLRRTLWRSAHRPAPMVPPEKIWGQFWQVATHAPPKSPMNTLLTCILPVADIGSASLTPVKVIIAFVTALVTAFVVTVCTFKFI
jgi:hypothetical protein